MRRVNFFIIVIILLTSCISDFISEFDKIGEPYWNPEIGAPIVSGEFTIEDYIDAISDDIKVTQDADGVVVFEYQGPGIVSDRAEDLIEVPGQSFTKGLNFDLVETNGLPVTGTITKSYSYTESITIEDGENDSLDSLFLKSGTLSLAINGDLPVSGEMDIRIKSIIIDDQPFARSITWTNNPSNPGQTYNEDIDLSGAFVDFTDNNNSNTFSFEVDVTINYQGEPITPVDEIEIAISVTDPRFRLLYGKFSEREFTTERETVALGLLEKVEANGFYLDDPSIAFEFKSSFGVPVEARIVTLEAVNSDQQTLAFTGSAISDPITVSSPALDEVGSFASTALKVDKTNSNIRDIIAFIPIGLDYQFEGSVKPSDPLAQQFVMDTSQVVGEYSVILPLSGRVADFSTEKEFAFDGSDFDVFSDSKIIVKTSNGLPITVSIELSFLDANGFELLSLFAGTNILDPGETDSNGLVISESTKTIEEELSASELELLTKAKKAVLKSTLFTGTAGIKNVKIRLKDRVKVGLFIQTSLDF